MVLRLGQQLLRHLLLQVLVEDALEGSGESVGESEDRGQEGGGVKQRGMWRGGGRLAGGASLPQQLLLNCTCLYLSCSDQVVLGVFWGGSNTCEPSEHLASWDLSAQGCCGLGEGAASWPALSLTCVAPDRHGWCGLRAAQQLL